MKIICDTTEFQMEQKSAVAIGKFDGVHRGHMELLSHIIQMKKKKMAAVVFTFHPSAAVFFGQSKEAELTTRYEKRQLFESMGVDVLVEFPLNKETAATSPEEFVEKILARQMQAGYIAAGADVSFGYKGLGNKELLIRMAGQLDYQVEIINKVYEEAREISSTYVREEVEKGDMEKTARLLGRFYSFEGQVERGNRLGRKLGMPTLNLYPERVPLGLEVGDYSIVDDENFNQAEFLKKVADYPKCPRSSCPSPERFLESYREDADHVYAITLSSHLSGSYNSAMLGRKLYLEKYGEKKIHVVDSESASGGETQIALKLMELEEAGLPFEDIVKKIEEFRDSMHTYFVLDNLETLRKNGRLSGVKALVASTLSIKPVMGSDKGEIIQRSQTIGIKKALGRMAELAASEAKRPEERRLIITHCNAPS